MSDSREKKRKPSKIDWTTDAVNVLIDCVRENKSFWDPRSASYSNKMYRQQILERVARNLEMECGFYATPAQIATKWQGLKAYFSTCNQKYTHSTRSGVETDEVEDLTLNPGWEFYEKLKFLREKMAFTPSVNSFNLQNIEVLDSTDNSIQSDCSDSLRQNIGLLSQESSESSMPEFPREVYVSSFTPVASSSRANTPMFVDNERPGTSRSVSGSAPNSRPGTPHPIPTLAQTSRSSMLYSVPMPPQSSRSQMSRPVSQLQLSEGLIPPVPERRIPDNTETHQPHTQTRKKQKKDETNDEMISKISTRLLDRLDENDKDSKYFHFGQHIAKQLHLLEDDIADDLIHTINNALYDAKKQQRSRAD